MLHPCAFSKPWTAYDAKVSARVVHGHAHALGTLKGQGCDDLHILHKDMIRAVDTPGSCQSHFGEGSSRKDCDGAYLVVL